MNPPPSLIKSSALKAPAAGHGFGSAMFDTAALMTSADVTIKFRQEYGHVDYQFSTTHLQELEHPIFNWLLQGPLK